jgi:hypothetical protein
LAFGLISLAFASAPFARATKNGLPSEPSVIPTAFSSLAGAAAVAAASAAPAMKSLFNIERHLPDPS